MFFTDYQGSRVACRRDGAGPPLVLVHGTGGDGETNWSALAEALSDRRTILRPDLSGSGATRDDGRPLTAEFLGGQVVAAADAAGADRFDLMGFSLGAAIAAVVAAAHHGRVRSLVLLAGFAAADARLRLEFALWRDLIARDRRAMARLAVLTGFSAGALSRWDDATIDAAVEATLAGTDWDGMARQVALDLAIDVRDRLPHIRAETLVIACRDDQMVPPAHARALAAAIPAARTLELSTGHLAPMEDPPALADIVRTFLDTIDGAAGRVAPSATG